LLSISCSQHCHCSRHHATCRYYYPKQRADALGSHCGLWTCGTELPTSGAKLDPDAVLWRDFAYTPTPPTPALATPEPTAAPAVEAVFTQSSAVALTPLGTFVTLVVAALVMY
jgi:hypothetical protein